MAKVIRSASIATENWKSRAGTAAPFYGTQVEAASWKVFAASDTAEGNYAKGVGAAVSGKTRKAAIDKIDDSVWKAGVKAVGISRYGSGVTASAPRFESAFGKLIPAIDSIRKSLGPRGIRGSSENIARMTKQVQDLSKRRGEFKARGVGRA